MLVSTRGRYALRMMVYLGQTVSDEPVSLSEIAIDEEISLKYLEQLCSDLLKAKLIKGVRGRYGGYQLAKPAGKITVLDILEAVEDNGFAAVNCLTDDCDECPRIDACSTIDFWKEFNKDIRTFAKKHTLQMICEK